MTNEKTTKLGKIRSALGYIIYLVRGGFIPSFKFSITFERGVFFEYKDEVIINKELEKWKTFLIMGIIVAGSIVYLSAARFMVGFGIVGDVFVAWVFLMSTWYVSKYMNSKYPGVKGKITNLLTSLVAGAYLTGLLVSIFVFLLFVLI